ncbi:MAG: hypothetical protein FJX76_27620 [Armatimonadetes bacterium]|nr:hypothetical protein [Armatimonadota bacterium]
MATLMIVFAGMAVAQQHEIGLTLGRLLAGDRTRPQVSLNLGAGTALQANYGYRLAGGERAALYGEVHLLANPLRDIRSLTGSVTRDVATLYVTPGIRVKFAPRAKVSPYVLAGGCSSLDPTRSASIVSLPQCVPFGSMAAPASLPRLEQR